MRAAALIILLLVSLPAWADSGVYIRHSQLFIAGLGLLVAIAGAWAGRIFRDTLELSTLSKVRKYIGVGITTIGVFIIVGAFTNPLKRLPANGNASDTWYTSESTCLAAARESRRPVIIDFWATYCRPCITMYQNTLLNAKVRAATRQIIKCKLNLSANKPQNQYLWSKKRYFWEGSELPRVIFITSDGRVNRGLTVKHVIGPDDFITRVRQIDQLKSEKTNLISRWLSESGLLLTMVFIFAAGLGTSLTPCVYPLIPITINVIGAAKKGDSRWHGFTLSSAYVGGLVLMYSSLGLVAALAGGSVGKIAQNGWVVSCIVALFIAMGLSFLGLFTIQLPTALQTKLSAKGGAGHKGAFILGLVSGLIAAPCVGPVLLALLAWVAKDGNPLKGFSMLLVFALGLGTLFLFIGTFTDVAKQRLPRSGAWMEGVKVLFAISFFVLGLYYLNTIVPSMARIFHGLQSLNPFV